MEKNKVLIVDDISENIETISEMIKDFDIDVKTANVGKEPLGKWYDFQRRQFGRACPCDPEHDYF